MNSAISVGPQLQTTWLGDLRSKEEVFRAWAWNLPDDAIASAMMQSDMREQASASNFFGVWIVILPSMPEFDRENIAEDGLGRLRCRHVDEIEGDTVGNIFG
jgi:hypothetical protein